MLAFGRETVDRRHLSMLLLQHIEMHPNWRCYEVGCELRLLRLVESRYEFKVGRTR